MKMSFSKSRKKLKAAVVCARVLRDQLLPLKVDNANRIAIFDTVGNTLPGAVDMHTGK